MNLYHYSKDEHKLIQSLQSRNAEVTDDRLKLDAGGVLPPYSTSISFFFNQIPNNLPDILDNKHNFWKPMELFEYQIDTSNLPKDVIYYVAETPEWVKFTDRFDWSKAKDSDIRKEYMLAIRKWEVENGFIGQGVKDFVEKASNYTGDLGTYYRNAYKLAKKEDGLDNFFSKYATYVPHAMLYHENFKINKFKVRGLELTSKNSLGTELFKNTPHSVKF